MSDGQISVKINLRPVIRSNYTLINNLLACLTPTRNRTWNSPTNLSHSTLWSRSSRRREIFFPDYACVIFIFIWHRVEGVFPITPSGQLLLDSDTTQICWKNTVNVAGTTDSPQNCVLTKAHRISTEFVVTSYSEGQRTAVLIFLVVLLSLSSLILSSHYLHPGCYLRCFLSKILCLFLMSFMRTTWSRPPRSDNPKMTWLRVQSMRIFFHRSPLPW